MESNKLKSLKFTKSKNGCKDGGEGGVELEWSNQFYCSNSETDNIRNSSVNYIWNKFNVLTSKLILFGYCRFIIRIGMTSNNMPLWYFCNLLTSIEVIDHLSSLWLENWALNN